MVQIAGKSFAAQGMARIGGRFAVAAGGLLLLLGLFYGACVARVNTDEFGVEQHRFGSKTGIGDEVFGPGLYLVGPGTTMHTFSREVHVLEATFDRAEALKQAPSPAVKEAINEYFDRQSAVLGAAHRVIEALNVQTSDGYSVSTDVTLLYSIADAAKVGREFGWGSLYVDAFVINTFRNGVLTTLGKMNAESFYDEKVRIAALAEAETFLRDRFQERGFRVETLLLRGYRYQDSYEKSLHDKKVAVQLAEKNRKQSLVNDERAKLQQIESKGNATITIAESEVSAKISKIVAEAALYSSEVHANADKDVGLAEAEAKRLKADALNKAGGRYVVALETAKIFDNIKGAVMTPEQYLAFIRGAWALLGLSPGGKEGGQP